MRDCKITATSLGCGHKVVKGFAVDHHVTQLGGLRDTTFAPIWAKVWMGKVGFIFNEDQSLAAHINSSAANNAIAALIEMGATVENRDYSQSGGEYATVYVKVAGEEIICENAGGYYYEKKRNEAVFYGVLSILSPKLV